MISVFLSKLLTSRQANFTEENISIFNLFFTLQPVESLVDLQKNLEDKFGKRGEEVISNFGRKISSTMIDHFKKNFKIEREHLKDLWLNMFSLSGLGKLNIVKFDSKSAIFQTDSSSIAKIYLSKYKKSKEPVCHLISSMLEVYFEEVTGKKVKCRETSCVAARQKFCTFEISSKV